MKTRRPLKRGAPPLAHCFLRRVSSCLNLSPRPGGCAALRPSHRLIPVRTCPSQECCPLLWTPQRAQHRSKPLGGLGTTTESPAPQPPVATPRMTSPCRQAALARPRPLPESAWERHRHVLRTCRASCPGPHPRLRGFRLAPSRLGRPQSCGDGRIPELARTLPPRCLLSWGRTPSGN